MSHHTSHKFETIPTQDHSDELGHVVPFKIYLTVCLSLLALTIITVAVSRVDLGVMNMVVAMLVASVKAMMVALFFMHLKYEKYTTWLYALFPIILLGILIGGVFIDNPLRDKPEPVHVKEVPQK